MFQIFVPKVLSGAGVALLREKGCDVKVGYEDLPETGKLPYDAILSGGVNGIYYDGAFMDRCENCKIIASFSAGVERVDIPAATARGIYVSNSGPANSNAVAEHVMFLMLACAKNAGMMIDAAKRGDFAIRDNNRNDELDGKTVGIIGFGNIGRRIANKCIHGFGMKVLAYDPYADPANVQDGVTLVEDLYRLLEQCDYVSLNLPLTGDNVGFFNTDKIRHMKPTAYLINAARGGLVCEEDLVAALEQKLIAGAGLDVYVKEPTSPDNPLLHFVNVITTPHCAADTGEAHAQMELNAAQDILRVLFQGEKPVYLLNHPEGK